MRYERQLPIVGDDGQRRIENARVGIAGCGGLGVNVLTNLVTAGVTQFVLCDPDVPDITNLNRQYIYYPGDMRPKAEVAAQWVLALNPIAEVEAHAEPFSKDTSSMFLGCDVIIDCLDSFSSRMELSDFACENRIPLVHGGVDGLNGQVYVMVPGETPSLREVYGDRKDPDGPAASLGAAVACIASMESVEAVKLLAGMRSDARGRLVTVDMGDWTVESAEISPREDGRGSRRRSVSKSCL